MIESAIRAAERRANYAIEFPILIFSTVNAPVPEPLTTMPVFPLPEFHLFPGTMVPLHVFETRYRQMVNDLMDSAGRLIIAPLAPDAPRTDVGPKLPAMGTLAEIVQTEELDDGRWLILLLALARVEVTEVPSKRLYRLA